MRGWWLRQARALADPAGTAAGTAAFERDLDTRVGRLREAARAAYRERRSPTRPRMRAMTLRPRGRLAFRSVPAPPPPGPLGAVVHPIAMATCDLDRPIVRGETPFPVPFQYGHECVAEVLSVGADVADVRPGDRVVVPFQISCGACSSCTAGHTSNCQAVPPLSMYGFGVTGGHWGGVIADEVAVPFADGMLVRLPDGVDPVAAASVADNVCDAYRHIGPNVPADRLLIVGPVRTSVTVTASVPFYTALIAQALGVDEVVYADARPAVRQAAEQLGITAVTPREMRRLEPASLVADVSTTPAGLRLALSLTAPDGLCTSSGSLHFRSAIPTALMYARNATLRLARTQARAVIPEVLELVADGRLQPERVTTLVAPMDDAEAALAEHVRGGSAKTIITADA